MTPSLCLWIASVSPAQPEQVMSSAWSTISLAGGIALRTGQDTTHSPEKTDV
jgi:hypothetical protein